MKTKIVILPLFCFFFVTTLFGQRLTPDVDLISEIISQKQDEIKRRVIKNLIVKNIKTTNYTAYNSMYYLMDVITTEKNKTVMTKDIIKEVAQYGINYALAEYFVKNRLDDLTYNIDGGAERRITSSDNNALAILLSLNVIKDSSAVESDKIVQKETGFYTPNNILRAWEANYIIDKMYESLSNASIPIFKEIGIFKKEDLTKRFTSGLNFSYKAPLSSYEGRPEFLDGKIADFVKEIESLVDEVNVDGVFQLLKSHADDFNLKNLKNTSARSIRLLFELFSFSLTEYKAQIGENSFLARIGKIIEKYVIYDLAENDDQRIFKSFKIDVEAIILSFEDVFIKKTYMKNSFIGIKPFFVIGMNYGVLADSNSTILEDDGAGSISDLAYISEKFGIKFMLADFGYARSHKPNEWYKYRGYYKQWLRPKSEPLIDDIYVSLYGSGILYNVVDLKSKDNFDFAIVGIGTGISFFNNLELSVSYAVPFINKSLSYENAMFTLGFDIPIFEYIAALKKKNK